jgi:hypothetical protein
MEIYILFSDYLMENLDCTYINESCNFETMQRSSLSHSLTMSDRPYTEVRSSVENFQTSHRGSRGKTTRANEESSNDKENIHYENLSHCSEQNLRASGGFIIVTRKASQENLTEVKKLDTEKFKYIGETQNGKKHGFGICNYQNGDYYIGKFNNDKKEGWGKYFVKASGKTFHAEFINNQIEGFVEYSNRQGITHYGYMKNHKFLNNSPMAIINPSKYEFQGIMQFDPVNNKLAGLATINYSNGNIYQGETVESCEDGWGILKRKDNFIFKGQKRSGKFNGYCEIYYPDKSKHYGYFSENKREGLGISISHEGVYCICKYQNDFKEGGCLICCKNNTKMELYHSGFMVKTIEKDQILNYTTIVYPEYNFLCQVNNQKLAEILWRESEE